MNCPACSHPKAKPYTTDPQALFSLRSSVVVCTNCQAVYTTTQIYLGDSYTIVKPWFAPADVPPERTRYYDLECLGSDGLTRRHGWYDPSTKLITQVG